MPEFPESKTIAKAEFAEVEPIFGEAKSLLTVTFRHGKDPIYRFWGATKEEYDGLVKAESAGHYFQTAIRPNFKRPEGVAGNDFVRIPETGKGQV
jgi:KTSC domain